MTDFPLTREEDEVDGAVRKLLASGCHSRLAELARHWQSLRPSGPGRGSLLPGRPHIDPAAMPRLMPAIFFADVEREPRLRFRIRLIGTRLARLFARDPTRRYADEIMPGIDASPLGTAFRAVVESGLPNHGGSPVTLIPGKEHLRIERLLLPLADDGRSVDTVLGMVILSYENGRERSCPESFAHLIRRRLRIVGPAADRVAACSCSTWLTTPILRYSAAAQPPS